MATATGQRVAKKKKKTAEAAPCLPDHLVAEVLVRLPARSLARLRCACRSWDAEISSRAFQERHHALAAAKLAFLELAPAHITNLVVIGRGRPAPLLANCRDCPSVIVSKACFGLVLVQKRCNAAYSVRNPTTGEVLHLPPSDDHRKCSRTGFGFHASAGEFKVVRVSIQLGKLHARVLTVGDARGWRAPAAAAAAVGDLSDDDGMDPYVEPVFADGCLHWCFRGTQYLDKPHGILSFSLADESFRRVAQPSFSTADLVPYDINQDNQQHEHQLWRARGVRSSSEGGEEDVAPPVGKTLAELDGRLCMMRDVRHRTDVGSLLFEIWRLQDYDTGSWSLDYRIDLKTGHMAERLTTPWLVVPLRYLEEGGGGSQSQPQQLGAKSRKLLLATTAREAHVYDPDSGTLRTVASVTTAREAHGHGYDPDSWTVAGGDNGNSADNSLRLVLYQESLVRFTHTKQGKGEIEFVKVDYD